MLTSGKSVGFAWLGTCNSARSSERQNFDVKTSKRKSQVRMANKPTEELSLGINLRLEELRRGVGKK